MVCRNICEKIYSKIEVGKSHYLAGKKYCRRCEIYLYHEGVFAHAAECYSGLLLLMPKYKAKIRKRLQK
jgi:hypothetical protein